MKQIENSRRAAFFLLFFPALFPALPSAAAGPGTSAATFLDLGFGARPIGFGEAYVAMADDVSAVHYNPAGLSLHQPAMRSAPGPYEMLFTHTLYVQGISLDQLGLVRRPWGLSVTSLRIGGIEGRTLETDAPSNFGASDLAVGASYGRTVGPVGLGATLKYIHETIGNASADAYAVDLGALHRFENYPVSVGADLANLGTKVRFVDQAFPLPLVLRAGVTYGQTKSFPHALSLQIDTPRDGAPFIRLGAEYQGFGPFALRVGYRTFSGGQKDAVLGKSLGSTASGFSEFYGLFLGMGLQTKLGNLDYAIMPYGELGLAHRLSLGLRFGGPH
ncbi:MAG: PorV/PorQ family protein [Elusimicrobia bacterium]|nr:PorV/PorQ family protein [Elusimicrobiota bacterium]MDE2512396.1 PorV/PorQ family protein [Elusimicrobiota bacterium]